MFQRTGRTVLILFVGAWLGLGCSEPEQQAQPAAPVPTPAAAPAESSASAQAEAEKIFAERCVTCHGARGAGDGPASAGLVPKPRNFQDTEWQKTVSDEYIEQIIQYGGAAVGKSPAMPGNPDLTGKPAVLAELRVQIRALAK